MARYQLGARLGGEQGESLREEARADARTLGVVPAYLDEHPAVRQWRRVGMIRSADA